MVPIAPSTRSPARAGFSLRPAGLASLEKLAGPNRSDCRHNALPDRPLVHQSLRAPECRLRPSCPRNRPRLDPLDRREGGSLSQGGGANPTSSPPQTASPEIPQHGQDHDHDDDDFENTHGAQSTPSLTPVVEQVRPRARAPIRPRASEKSDAFITPGASALTTAEPRRARTSPASDVVRDADRVAAHSA